MSLIQFLPAVIYMDELLNLIVRVFSLIESGNIQLMLGSFRKVGNFVSAF
jgi:hypothetical protein